METISKMIEDMRRPHSLLSFEDIASYLDGLTPLELSKVLNDCIVTILVIGKLGTDLGDNKKKMAPLIADLLASAMMETTLATFKVAVTTVLEALEYNPVVTDAETKETPTSGIYRTNFYNN